MSATEVRLWYDQAALYLGWTCEDYDIQATFTQRDSRFWEEEVVEFFVTPAALDRYFELQWNPLGGTFDAIISNELERRRPFEAIQRRLVVHGREHDLCRSSGWLRAELDAIATGAGPSRCASRSPI